MPNREIFKSEIFFERCRQATAFIYKKFFRNYNKWRNDLINTGIAYIYQNEDKLLKFKDINTFEFFKEICRIAHAGIRQYIYSEKKQSFIDFSDCLNTQKDLNSNNKMSEDFFCFMENRDFKVEDNLNFEILINYLKEFLETIEIKKQMFIKDFICGYSIYEISKKYKMACRWVSETIFDFQNAFGEFLLDVGYFENRNVIDFSKKIKARRVRTFEKQEALKNGKFVLYDNDMMIYEILRGEKDLARFADVLKISEEKLKKIIFHSQPNIKLFLFDVQKLRKQFFKNYSFEFLVGDVKCCC